MPAPTILYGEFVELLHRGKVIGIHDDGNHYVVPQFIRQHMAALESYDFGDLLNEGHADYISKELLQQALHGVGRVAGAPAMMVVENNVSCEERAYILNIRHKNKALPFIVSTRVSPQTNPEPTELDLHFETDVFYFSNGTWYMMMGERSEFTVVPLMLNNILTVGRNVRYEMAEHVGTNVRRTKAGYDPVKPSKLIDVIHLTEIVRIRATGAKEALGGTHASPIPHERQGYSYYRKGKRIVVPGPIKVRGGNEARPPMQHVVVL